MICFIAQTFYKIFSVVHKSSVGLRTGINQLNLADAGVQGGSRAILQRGVQVFVRLFSHNVRME